MLGSTSCLDKALDREGTVFVPRVSNTLLEYYRSAPEFRAVT